MMPFAYIQSSVSVILVPIHLVQWTVQSTFMRQHYKMSVLKRTCYSHRHRRHTLNCSLNKRSSHVPRLLPSILYNIYSNRQCSLWIWNWRFKGPPVPTLDTNKASWPTQTTKGSPAQKQSPYKQNPSDLSHDSAYDKREGASSNLQSFCEDLNVDISDHITNFYPMRKLIKHSKPR
jgi:hypothetical protein